MKKIAFVIPWYGDNIQGGAEAECNKLVHCFNEAGVEAEVLTTCVKQASDDRGKNTMKAGVFTESGITVRRFKVRRRNAKRFHAANYKLYHNLPASLEDEKAYFEEDINSPAMYAYIAEHKKEYEYFIFMPYLYGVIYNGTKVCPDNCVMIPCFHDESYAHMKLVREMTMRMKGLIFLSQPEYQLAQKLYDLSNIKTAVLGAYVESGWESRCCSQSFREKYNIYDDFILCAGRKDAGKKVDVLVEYFQRYKSIRHNTSLKLVLIGGGTVKNISPEYRNDIIDLGFVSEGDKHNAMAAALCLCNPSHFESFSIVIMESWLAKRPVLVAQQCNVTTNFCRETNGGLYYDTPEIFFSCVDFFLTHADIANQMGQNGYTYVKENFIGDSILNKYKGFLEELAE